MPLVTLILLVVVRVCGDGERGGGDPAVHHHHRRGEENEECARLGDDGRAEGERGPEGPELALQVGIFPPMRCDWLRLRAYSLPWGVIGSPSRHWLLELALQVGIFPPL